jgi:Flp pilus assembly protein TadG
MRRLGLFPHDKPHARAGQSVVEFALVSLTILIITFGIVDIGRAVFQRSMLANATREAARYASVNGQSCCIDNIAAYAAQRSPTLNLTSANFSTPVCTRWNASTSNWDSVSCSSSSVQLGDRLQIGVNYTFNTSASLLLPVPPITMTESATVTIQ